jgi:hypothetical protein
MKFVAEFELVCRPANIWEHRARFSRPGFLFHPCGYDEPEILPSGSPSIFLMGADREQVENIAL